MSEFITSIWPLLCLSMFPLALWYLVEAKIVLNLLKSEHPQVWLELGSFQLIKNNTISSSYKFMVFILKADYRLLKDEKLSRKGKLLRYLLISGHLIVAFAFLAPIIIGRQ
ncbi:hypothetical protein EKG38_02465 [Shewanella canadensis]|uniref:Uncharacterized protein n=1 Tax=Shewanella canadensis TaxID=271096 RepID=A0A431WZF6_9GAMM|nr:hypothetical protein [Shewanella canadensis]RTR40795.1 hypothetical protein EKG38_02465 [Shewanella canadensis]